MKPAAASPPTGFVDPIRLTISLWLFVMIGAALSDLNPVQPAYVMFVVAGVGAHVIGMWLCRISMPRPRLTRTLTASLPTPLAARQRNSNQRISFLFLGLLSGGLFYFLAAYAEVVPSLDAVGLLAARNAYLDEVRGLSEKRFIYTTHLTLVGIATMFFTARAHWVAVERGLPSLRLELMLISVVTFLIALLTTGRTAPLLVTLSLAFYCLRFSVYSKTAIVTAFLSVFLLMFFGVAAALGKEGLGDSYQVDTGEALANLGRIYFFSAPVALQEVVLRGEVVSNACSDIFSYPVDLLKKVGLFSECEPRELDFVFVPVATNVFTFLRAYWSDFGYAYLIALFISGLLVEFVHRRAFDGYGFATYIFPFVLNSVLLQIFEEQLFSNGSVFAYLTVSYLICKALFRDRARDCASVRTASARPARA